MTNILSKYTVIDLNRINGVRQEFHKRRRNGNIKRSEREFNGKCIAHISTMLREHAQLLGRE